MEIWNCLRRIGAQECPRLSHVAGEKAGALLGVLLLHRRDLFRRSAVGRDGLMDRPTHVSAEMVLQVFPDAWKIVNNVNTERAQFIGRTYA